jgi:hypothetical protein
MAMARLEKKSSDSHNIKMATKLDGGCSSGRPKDIKILQNHEKIMEVQNRWTGNGKFIIKERENFTVSAFFLIKKILHRKKVEKLKKNDFLFLSNFCNMRIQITKVLGILLKRLFSSIRIRIYQLSILFSLGNM